MKRTPWMAVLVLLLVPSGLWAQEGLVQSGVGDDRVSLPDGPGSLGGMGDNATVTGNQGQMAYSVPFEVRAGFPLASPSFALSYNSGGGSGLAGMGWNLAAPAIERMTSRGLPRYTTADAFTANDELVAIPSTTPPVYRARFEGGFVRYTWLNAGAGAEGYWKAELPNGVVQYFGATADGTLVPNARVGGTAGTFRYHLVESVDPHGHAVRWTYAKVGNQAYPTEVGWLHDGTGTAQASIQFAYEAREDLVSDCKPGFNLVVSQRLKTVRSRSAGQVMMRYELSYEPYTASGGGSRLQKVDAFAGDATPSPLKLSLGYSRALGGLCTGAGCGQPYTKAMGTIGVTLQARTATLMDLNGDALPDLLETPTNGVHRIRLGVLQANGTHTFAPAVDSAVMQSSSFELNDGSVQVLDLDGDGLTDMVNARTGSVLINGGDGDWLMAEELGSSAVNALPNFDTDAMDGERSIRFLDYDNDKRIDVIQATQAATTIYRNDGVSFAQDMGVQAIGKGFQEDNLQLSDMNGDGLLDAVTVAPGVVSYRLNLGRGVWGPNVDITGLPISDTEAAVADLEDINGDGTADLLVVLGNQVKYAVNKNGASFLDVEVITNAEVPGIPERLGTTTVLTADMNGNGSTDVVWVDGTGVVTYLELFPVRPNLLSRIENGLGQVTTVQYRSAVDMMAAATGADAWTLKVPQSTLVVSRMEITEGFANVVEDSTYVYRDPYYDGSEKQFRGFRTVEMTSDADDTQESSRTVTVYDVGVTDRYRAGLVLTVDTFSDGRAIRSDANVYADCPLTGVPMNLAPYPVRYVCNTLNETVTKEGTPAAEWVTTRTEREFDGYGNTTLEKNLGVSAVGGQGCAACDGALGNSNWGQPCGMQCLGDERYTETTYAAPTANGRWVLNLPVTVKSYGAPGGDASEVTTFYDGPDFTGLAQGLFDRGLPTRVVAKRNATETVTSQRLAYNADGQVTASLDPLGSPTGQDHKRTYTYDASGLNVVQTDLHLVDSAGAPYQLRRTYSYEPLFNSLASASAWRVVRNGTAQGATADTFFGYDGLNRLTAVVRPGGDTLASPTQSITYAYGNPVSTVTTMSRPTVGQATVETQVACKDGFGRTVQTRRQTGTNAWLVSGFARHNSQGEVVEVFQPYTSTSSACDTAPPVGTPSEKMKLDGTGRVIEVVHGDAADFGGTPTSQRFRFLPLAQVNEDEADATAGHPNAGTPVTFRMNGLGRRIALERKTASDAAPTVIRFHYDSLGYVAGVTDPAGNRKTQVRDLLGRVVSVDDPDTGVTTFTHDAAGNVTRVVDARSVALVSTYDGLNRLLTRHQEGRQAETQVTYAYDAAPQGCDATDCTNVAGQLALASYPLEGTNRGLDWFGYDVRQLLRHTSRSLNGTVFEFTSERDNLSRITRKTYPAGRALTFERDLMGRLTAIPGHVTSVGYDDTGLMEAFTVGNGITRTMARDLRERTTAVSHRRADGTVVAEQSYVWDRHDQLMEVTDGRPEDALPHGNARYTHDGFGRVTRMELDRGRAAFAETLDLTYDALDNVLSRTSSLGAASPAHLGTVTYGGGGAGPRAATAAGGLTYAYDAAGHMVTRGAQTLVTDHLGRLARVEEGGRTQVSYAYGPEQGLMVRHEGASTLLMPGNDYEVRDGVSSLLVQLGAATLVSVDKADLQTTLYRDVAPASVAAATTPNPDGVISAADAWVSHAAGASILPALAQAGSDPDALLMASARRLVTGTGEKATYMHHDRTGSVLATTDQAGAVLERSEFYPFGLERLAPTSLRERMRFTGQEKDASGLIHHGARALDPVLGRWTSADPTFVLWDDTAVTSDKVDEALSGYAYVRNRLGYARDATGRESDEEDDVSEASESEVESSGPSESSDTTSTARNTRTASTSRSAESASKQESDAPVDAPDVDTTPGQDGKQSHRIEKADFADQPSKGVRKAYAITNAAIVAVVGLVSPLNAGRRAANERNQFGRLPKNRLKAFTKAVKLGYVGNGTTGIARTGYIGAVQGVYHKGLEHGLKPTEVFNAQARSDSFKRRDPIQKADALRKQYKQQKAADKKAAKANK